MAKIKISQRQYNTILLHEQNARLMASNELLNETTTSSTQISEEVNTDVVLGVSSILGVPLTGKNRADAEKALESDVVITGIKKTLEHKDDLEELDDSLEEKGLKNAKAKLAARVNDLVKKFNELPKAKELNKKIGLEATINLESLD